jgi:Zn-dependent oligopeptidase
MTTDTNPLLITYLSKNNIPDFDKINLDHFLPALDYAISEARGKIHDIIDQEGCKKFKDVVIPLTQAMELFNDIFNIYSVYPLLNTHLFTTDLHREIQKKSREFRIEIYTNPMLFSLMNTIRNEDYSIEEGDGVLFYAHYNLFLEHGVLLNNHEKEEIYAIDQEIESLKTIFTNASLNSNYPQDNQKTAALLNIIALQNHKSKIFNLHRNPLLDRTIGHHETIQRFIFDYINENKRQYLKQEEENGLENNISTDQITPYFEIKATVTGIIAHFERLFNLSIIKNDHAPKYHQDTKLFEVYEQDGRFLGGFYLDLYKRPQKAENPYCTEIIKQGQYKGHDRRPIMLISCRIQKPEDENTPLLLTYDDVKTILHEMGHAMHAIFSETKHQVRSGFNGFKDFCETHAFLQEKWAYEPETLRSFARHYQTGNLIPTEMIEHLRKQDEKNEPLFNIYRIIPIALETMLYHETISMNLSEHNHPKFEQNVLEYFGLPQNVDNIIEKGGLDHIFTMDYQSIGYSHALGQVVANMIFKKFQADGLYNPHTAQCYRKEMLATGGSKHPTILYKNFMGTPLSL